MVSMSLAAQQVCDTSTNALSSPTERFDDNGDGTVTDRQSGLMWARCAVGQQWDLGACKGTALRLDWPSAQASAASLNRSGTMFFSDWRLPSLRDLATIAERQCRNPRINLTVFPGTSAVPHWSSTLRPGAASAASAFTLSFGDEGIEYQSFGQQFGVRLVRQAR
jgi:Protein of unknown function (DUF1566)